MLASPLANTVPAAAKSLQSCLTLCNPIDGSPPGSTVPGILQARTLEWVAISFSNAWKWKVKVKSLSRVQLFVTPWTVAHQAPPSMGFSRQEYWSGVPLPSPHTVPSLTQKALHDRTPRSSCFMVSLSTLLPATSHVSATWLPYSSLYGLTLLPPFALAVPSARKALYPLFTRFFPSLYSLFMSQLQQSLS